VNGVALATQGPEGGGHRECVIMEQGIIVASQPASKTSPELVPPVNQLLPQGESGEAAAGLSRLASE